MLPANPGTRTDWVVGTHVQVTYHKNIHSKPIDPINQYHTNTFFKSQRKRNPPPYPPGDTQPRTQSCDVTWTARPPCCILGSRSRATAGDRASSDSRECSRAVASTRSPCRPGLLSSSALSFQLLKRKKEALSHHTRRVRQPPGPAGPAGPWEQHGADVGRPQRHSCSATGHWAARPQTCVSARESLTGCPCPVPARQHSLQVDPKTQPQPSSSLFPMHPQVSCSGSHPPGPLGKVNRFIARKANHMLVPLSLTSQLEGASRPPDRRGVRHGSLEPLVF